MRGTTGFNPLNPIPLPHELAKRVVKGFVFRGFIDNAATLRSLTGALRRRRVGLLDEQVLLQRNAINERGGHANYFIEEFMTRASYAGAGYTSAFRSFPDATFSSSASLSDGFQCVARLKPEDFTATPRAAGDGVDYSITLRHIPAHQVPNVERGIELLQQRGFLNYFAPGEHLGGSVRHGLLPGLMIMQGRYAAAFETLCRAPRLLIKSNSTTLRCDTTQQQQQETNPSALQVLRTPENEIAKHSHLAQALLAHRPVNELSDALCRDVLQSVVGFDGLSEMVREFCRTVWNECLTRRVRRHGSLAVLRGDFVVADQASSSSSSSSGGGDDVPRGEAAKTESPELIILSEDEAAANAVYHVHDVLLPGLGHATKFSVDSSFTKSVVQSLVARGCAVGETRVPHSHSDFSSSSSSSPESAFVSLQDLFDPSALSFQDTFAGLWNVPGEYRRAVEFPRGKFSWSLDPDVELSEQELGFSLRRGESASTSTNGGDDSSSSTGASSNNNRMNKIQKTPRHYRRHALQEESAQQKLNTQLRRECLHKLHLTFSLPADTSPWMLIRELCKRERFVIDEGMRKSLSLRAETVKRTEAQSVEARLRILKRVQNKYRWAGGGVPEGFQTARLWNKVFHHNGMRRSLIPSPKTFDDVID